MSIGPGDIAVDGDGLLLALLGIEKANVDLYLVWERFELMADPVLDFHIRLVENIARGTHLFQDGMWHSADHRLPQARRGSDLGRGQVADRPLGRS
jgi:hypothetical protein